MVHSIPILPPVTLPTGSSAVQDLDFCLDNGGNTFYVRLVVPGNDTFVEVFKVTAAGAVTKIDEFSPAIGPWTGHPEGHTRKAVAVTCKLKGADVVSSVTCYDLTEPTRDHYQEQYVTRNVAVPFPQGVSPESGAGPAVYYAPEGEPEPGGGGGVTQAQIEEAVRAVFGLPEGATFLQAISGSNEGNFRQGIEDKVKDALMEILIKPSDDPHNEPYQARMGQLIKDRVYECMTENGWFPRSAAGARIEGTESPEFPKGRVYE